MVGAGPSAGSKARPAPAAAAAAAPSAPKPAAAPLASGPSDEQVKKLFEPGSYELVPHDGMRKTIAKRLQESKQTIPHFYVSVDVELDALILFERAVTAARDRGVVDEYVLCAAVGGDEAEAFIAVEPLHSSLCHTFSTSLMG